MSRHQSNETEDNSTASPELLSIGELAQSTGVSPDTIRVWERRYGRPTPLRLESGHRRYTREHVRWLRRVTEALSRGHRPSAVVHMPENELKTLLYPEASRLEHAEGIKEILTLVRAYRGAEVAEQLQAQARELGLAAFLCDFVGPLLATVGRAWADGELEVRHEHYLSHILEDVLRTIRLEIESNRSGPVVALATLGNEGHGLGLQMLAIAGVVAGARTQILGTNTPPQDIAEAAREMSASGVAISVSLATGGIETDRTIANLRRMLPAGVRLAVGGRGARGVRRGPRGVDYIGELSGIAGWIERLGSGVEPRSNRRAR